MTQALLEVERLGRTSTARQDREQALGLLSLAATNFANLGEVREPRSNLYHRVIQGIHELIAAITVCERAGLRRDEIEPYLLTARRIHRQSPFVARLQGWPRGYAGDFETIEYICDATNRAGDAGSVGYFIEDYVINTRVAQQHRNKVRRQADLILRTVHHNPAARILSIGCGGARDLRSVAHLLEGTKAEFVLCDSDPDALDYARAHLESLAGRTDFIQGMVPRVLSRLVGNGPFDLVLAGGLFDYLPDRWVELVVSEVWRKFLKPGGKLFFTNIASGNPYRVWMEYLADWTLIERDEPLIERLCVVAQPGSVMVARDETKLALLVEIAKPPCVSD
jgi:extracellular factor (EF) 3-hydroxypalmitic acid methyl ester biosynthesis protein